MNEEVARARLWALARDLVRLVEDECGGLEPYSNRPLDTPPPKAVGQLYVLACEALCREPLRPTLVAARAEARQTAKVLRAFAESTRVVEWDEELYVVLSGCPSVPAAYGLASGCPGVPATHGLAFLAADAAAWVSGARSVSPEDYADFRQDVSAVPNEDWPVRSAAALARTVREQTGVVLCTGDEVPI